MSRESEIVSSHEGDEDKEDEEEEVVESNSPLKWRRKKRTTSEKPEGAASKRGKITLLVSLDTECEHVPKRAPRAKPLGDS